MSTNYDVLDNPFGSKQEMEGYMFTTSTVPSISCLHPIECSPKSDVSRNLFIIPRTGLPANSDARLYNKGAFQVATSGVPSTSILGEIWASYDVVLRVPKINPSLLAQQLHWYGTAATAAAPLTNPLLTSNSGGTFYNSNFASLYSTSAVTLKIPGCYVLFYGVVTASTNIGAIATVSVGGNITQPDWSDAFTNFIFSTFTSNGASASLMTVVEVNATPSGSTVTANNVTIGGLTSMTGGVWDMLILPIPTVTGAATGF